MTRRDDLPDTSGVIKELQNEDGSIDARNLFTSGPDRDYGVSAVECYRIRAVLLRGVPLKQHFTAIDKFGEQTARKHATGDCAHRSLSLPPLSFGWFCDPGRGTGGTVVEDRSGPELTVAECREVRERILADGTLTSVASKMGISRDAARNHSSGTCHHAPQAVRHLPIRKGWHAPEWTPDATDLDLTRDSKVAADD